MIRVQSGGGPDETLESKKKKFNVIEKRLLYIMLPVLAVIFSLVFVEAILNHASCGSEKFGYLTDLIQLVNMITVFLCGLFFIRTSRS